MQSRLSAGASCLCPGTTWLRALALHFEGHMEQKEWLHYMATKVKKMAGYIVKLSKYCCTDNSFCKVHSKMTKQFGVTVIG